MPRSVRLCKSPTSPMPPGRSKAAIALKVARITQAPPATSAAVKPNRLNTTLRGSARKASQIHTAKVGAISTAILNAAVP